MPHNNQKKTPLSNEIQVRTLVVGELQTNCYLVWDEVTLECYVIDPADSGETISQVILEEGLLPQAILLTHGHFDHVLGMLEVKLNFSLPVYLHAADWSLLGRAARSAEHWLKHAVDPVPPADLALAEGSQLELGAHHLQVLHLPGHTPGSCGFFLAGDRDSPPRLFAGDTLFKAGVGRTDFSYSDSALLRQSLERLFGLPPETVVFPGHGEPTTIASEIKYSKLVNLA